MSEQHEQRILMVDDEPANLLLLRHLLERDGYRHHLSTTDPREALPLFRDFRPDLVLLDLNMPKLDGFGVMEQLRGEIGEAEFLPIVILTGDATPETRMRALSGGATDFITKPFDSLEVVLRIRNLLHTRSLHGAVREQNRRLEGLVAERTRELEVALRRAEAASEAKSLFLAKMSHELRTPLTPISGAMEMLAEMELSAGAGRMVQMAASNVRRMTALVNDILYLQSLEQEEARPDDDPVAVRALLMDLAYEAQARLDERELEIRVEGPAQLRPLRTDGPRLAEVLRRLLDNAVRFTPAGAVTLRVVGEEGGEPRRIEVQDTGIGIPADRREAIFEPFEQADNSSTRGYEGVGIGLTICRTLARGLGYRLGVESEPGRGSTFYLEL